MADTGLRFHVDCGGPVRRLICSKDMVTSGLHYNPGHKKHL